MATRQTTALVDDPDGGEARRTGRFGLGGVDYAIELAESNMEDLSPVLSPFITVERQVASEARRVSSASPSPTRPRSSHTRHLP